MMRSMRTAAGLAVLAAATLLAGCERPPMETVQRGFRGTGMEQVYNPRLVAADAANHQLPEAVPPVPPGGPPATQVYQNVKVLTDLDVGQFTRLMVAMTNWVAPKEGCNYCHNGANFADDSMYTKVVARKMLEMTRHINSDWQPHVAQTGVTCWTCHRGQPVPNPVWFTSPPTAQSRRATGNDAGQNAPADSVALASLPYDPLTPFLLDKAEIRVIGNTALPNGNLQSIKQTEWTYGLMMHMSDSLGVNCTYCHNTRSFAQWDASTPQRTTAWHGIRMARDLNVNYLVPLTDTFPAGRKGPTGDVAKVSCATCHQGVYKPLYGKSMLADHPELSKAGAPLQGAAPQAPADGPAAAAGPAVLYFDVGSAALPADAAKNLEALVATVKADPKAVFVVSGYHSASGTLEANQKLAKERAFAVRDALKAAGVPEAQVKLEKPQQTSGNASGEDQAARRVEVSVQPAS